MKVIIAGPRDAWITNEYMAEIIEKSGFKILEEVCGEAQGIDSCGKQWAIDNNIPVKSFPANWTLYGKSAGPKRNKEMALYADALIAVVKPEGSQGTNNMISFMKKLKKPVYIEEI